jgi:hypothetical protein
LTFPKYFPDVSPIASRSPLTRLSPQTPSPGLRNTSYGNSRILTDPNTSGAQRPFSRHGTPPIEISVNSPNFSRISTPGAGADQASRRTSTGRPSLFVPSTPFNDRNLLSPVHARSNSKSPRIISTPEAETAGRSILLLDIEDSRKKRRGLPPVKPKTKDENNLDKAWKDYDKLQQAEHKKVEVM